MTYAKDKDSVNEGSDLSNFGGHVSPIHKTPPPFDIKSRCWFWKVIEQGQHNWALIDCDENGKATAYFFHDCGKTLGRNPYKTNENEYSAIVDSINFRSHHLARFALNSNGFSNFEAHEYFECYMPKEKFWDAREYEGRIYSSGHYWRFF